MMSDSTVNNVSQYLTDFFAAHLPITEYLHMRVVEFTPQQFQLAIDLAPSINDKLTAFGGSLYCLCVMNCWGMAYLQARARGINPNMVISSASIDYIAPVKQDPIIASCHVDQVDWDAFFSELDERGRAKISLCSTVYEQGKVAVNFSGEYAIVGCHDNAERHLR
jgi:thioesterase domain-containing protein